MINWRIRAKNPMFWVQIAMSVLMPILAYMGLTTQDLTSWAKLGDVLLQALANPYIVGLVAVSVYNTIIDPTTTGISDSKRALDYTKPKGKEGGGENERG